MVKNSSSVFNWTVLNVDLRHGYFPKLSLSNSTVQSNWVTSLVANLTTRDIIYSRLAGELTSLAIICILIPVMLLSCIINTAHGYPFQESLRMERFDQQFCLLHIIEWWVPVPTVPLCKQYNILYTGLTWKYPNRRLHKSPCTNWLVKILQSFRVLPPRRAVGQLNPICLYAFCCRLHA